MRVNSYRFRESKSLNRSVRGKFIGIDYDKLTHNKKCKYLMFSTNNWLYISTMTNKK